MHVKIGLVNLVDVAGENQLAPFSSPGNYGFNFMWCKVL